MLHHAARAVNRVPRYRREHLAVPVALLFGLGGLAPIVVLAILSVFRVDDFDLVPAVSPRAWIELVSAPVYALLIGKALLSGAATAVSTALLGYPIALALRRLPTSLKGPALVVVLTPLYTGEIVRIYAWRVTLGAEGLVNSVLQALGLTQAPLTFLLFSPFTIALVLAYNNAPFMILSLWVAAETVEPRLIEAARDLGARPLDAFVQIVLPLTLPGLAAGVFTVFTLAAGEMLTPSLLGGTSGATAMALIENLFGTAFDWPMASALALALLAALFAVAASGAALLLMSRSARAVLWRAP